MVLHHNIWEVLYFYSYITGAYRKPVWDDSSLGFVWFSPLQGIMSYCILLSQGGLLCCQNQKGTQATLHQCVKDHNLSRAHVGLKCVSQVTHWSQEQVEKYNKSMSDCTKGGQAGRSLVDYFHKHAKIAAWQQRNNDMSLQKSVCNMSQSE